MMSTRLCMPHFRRQPYQLILEQIDEHHRGGHHDNFRKAIVQFGVLRVQAQFVALLQQTVAAHNDEIVPPQQATGHNKILLLALVAEQLPFAGEYRVDGDAGATGHRYIAAIVADGSVLRKEMARRPYR